MQMLPCSGPRDPGTAFTLASLSNLDLCYYVLAPEDTLCIESRAVTVLCEQYLVQKLLLGS